ncbi:MAG: ehbQ [Chloroflexi bacterium]|nr:ehbQ [Chloroflexota bacterium]
MTRRSSQPPTVAVRVVVADGPATISALIDRIGAAGGVLRNLSTVRRLEASPDAGADEAVERVEVEIEVEGLDEEVLVRTVHATPGVRAHRLTRSLDRIFGKRVIVIGGGAQVAQVALGAVSEADRHNLRGERISVDTIALVGEKEIAAAVRAVADLPGNSASRASRSSA